MPDGAVVAVHCPANLNVGLVCQLMRQQEGQVTPTGEGSLTAATQQCLGGNAGFPADF